MAKYGFGEPETVPEEMTAEALCGVDQAGAGQ
jgi:hypothetical protein